ncbi:hypothetical protein PR003_g14303 [Phytophthora rubi]|uniref:Crinkler effector protein N-terminal domain-containing protein n=1 Tax=Phytophthora rubi TaxID=129364 RepID=A0A6A3LVX5_9STRA|nr:hypothetical protein PR002_g13827 [Phytophthora rubi]KAE9023559.1 hypothetical protein PR001_g12884 [Phytophthora rubi]KAE9332871.1 hypothetical protein PR003_g14303 [Phytophthora rubi]
MVYLFCGIVGVAGRVFEVEIDDARSVIALKKAIKVEKPDTIKVEADKLQLFVAKRDDAWLTESDVKNGVKDTTGLKRLDAARSRISDVGLSEDAVKSDRSKEEVAALKGPVNVMVLTSVAPIYIEKLIGICCRAIILIVQC